MADADIVITGAAMMPNPVEAGRPFLVSVEVLDKVYVLDTGDGSALADDNGALIEIK